MMMMAIQVLIRPRRRPSFYRSSITQTGNVRRSPTRDLCKQQILILVNEQCKMNGGSRFSTKLLSLI